MVSFCKLIKKLIFNLFVAILTIILFTILPIAILILSPIYLFRFFIFKIAPICRPDLGKMMQTRSVLSAVDDMYKSPKINLVVGLQFEGVPKIDELLRLLKEKMSESKHDNGDYIYPELRSYVTSWMGFYFYKPEKKFDFYEHASVYDNGGKPVSETKLFEILRELIHEPHTPNKSPWTVVIIPNFVSNKASGNYANYENEDEKTAENDQNPKTMRYVQIFRCHHSLCDGYSIFKLFKHIADNEEELLEPNYVKRSVCEKLLFGISFGLRAPIEFIANHLKAFDWNAWHSPFIKMTKDVSLAGTEQIPLNYIKSIKSTNQVTFTAVILAALAGGVRNYMIATNVRVPNSISCVTALPMPGHPDKLRNHMTFCFVRLPLGIDDPFVRLRKIERHLNTLKKSTFPVVAFYGMPLLGGLFNWMVKPLIKNNLATAIMVNLPTSRERVFFAGNPIINVGVGAGLLPGSTAIGFSIISYFGSIVLGCGGDKAIIPTSKDAEELVSYFEKELDTLSKGEFV